MGPEELFAGHRLALTVFRSVRSFLETLKPLEVRTSKSQTAFRRRRGFAYLWLPGQYLDKPAADVVLSFALGRHDPSPRFKEVVQASPNPLDAPFGDQRCSKHRRRGQELASRGGRTVRLSGLATLPRPARCPAAKNVTKPPGSWLLGDSCRQAAVR